MPRYPEDYTREEAARDDWEEEVCRHMERYGFDDYDEAERDLLGDQQGEYYGRR